MKKGDVLFVTRATVWALADPVNLVPEGAWAVATDPSNTHPEDGGRIDWITPGIDDRCDALARCEGDVWKIVPADKVPDEVWAEVAKRALLGV